MEQIIIEGEAPISLTGKITVTVRTLAIKIVDA
jgi:hypothetical protein